MNELTKWLDQYMDELTPKQFYRMIFPEGELDDRGSMTKGKYTGIIIEVTNKKRKVQKKYKDGSVKEVEQPIVYRHTLTNSLEEIDKVLESRNFCLTPPLSYAGKVRSADNARFLYAIAIDLDDIRMGKNGEPIGLIDLWNAHIERVGRIPKPTMMVSSGSGLHLYYVFEKPIPLFPNVAKQLQKYKHELTRICWNEGIVDIDNDNDIQYEGIYQGFRMPGTITKEGKLKGTDERAKCYLTGEKVSVEYMNAFVDPKYQVTEFSYKSDLTLREAAEKYPEWYEERIVKGNKNVIHPWKLNRSVYDWWKNQIYSGAKVRHRYWCLWILAIFAKKCSFYDEKKNPNPVTREELESDAWELMDFLEGMTESEDNHFTEVDVIEALEAFEDKFISYPKSSIRYKANIPFEPSVKRREKGKRLKQDKHLETARAVQQIRDPEGTWRNKSGRPEGSKNKDNLKKKEILEYKEKHPKASVTEIAREVGVSRPTVYKYLENKKYKRMTNEKEYEKNKDIEGGSQIYISTENQTPEMIEERKQRLRAYYDALMGMKKEKEENE